MEEFDMKTAEEAWAELTKEFKRIAWYDSFISSYKTGGY